MPLPKKQGLCPFLVNGRRCPDRACPYSHKMGTIRWWKKKVGQKLCNHGAKCSYLVTGNCIWFHPAEHHARVDRLRIERVAEVSHGLKHREMVTVAPFTVGVNLISIADVEELASFNKVSDGEIAVPGCPPRFTPLTQSLQIKSNSYNQGVRVEYPQYTHIFEPLLQSVQLMRPTINVFEDTDVVSNASNLRKLFDLLHNRTWAVDRFDIDTREETMLLSRWNKDPHLSSSLGCGAGFERETCRYGPEQDPVLQRSLSHHRVVSYGFGGLQLVVQSEVDAYHCDCNHFTPPPAPIAIVTGHTKRQSDSLPLSQGQGPLGGSKSSSRCSPSTAFAALALDDPGDSPAFTPAELNVDPPLGQTLFPDAPLTTTTSPSPTLLIHHTGHKIPSGCLVEVKTRNARSPPLSTNEAQLYFSRRTKLYLNQHEKGLFKPGPVVQEMEEELKAWEEQEQETLGKIAALLRLVRDRVRALKEEGVEKVSLVCECDGTGTEEGVRVRLCEREDGGEGLLPP